MSYLTLHGTQRVLKTSLLERTFTDTANGSAAGIERSEMPAVVGFDAATPQLVSDFARDAL